MKIFKSIFCLLLISGALGAQNDRDSSWTHILGPYTDTYSEPYFIKTKIHFFDTSNPDTDTSWWEIPNPNINLDQRANEIMAHINSVFNEYEIYFVTTNISSCDSDAEPVDACLSSFWESHHEEGFINEIRGLYENKNCMLHIFDEGPDGPIGGAGGYAYRIPNHFCRVNGKDENGIDASFSNAVIHELGHCLGLYHTHTSDMNCDEDVLGCHECGDYICDTPAHSDGGIDALNCTPSSGVAPVLIKNYMSYVNPRTCPDEFLLEQVNRMYAFLSMPAPEIANVLVENYSFPNSVPPTNPSVSIKISSGTMVIDNPLEMLPNTQIIVCPGATLEIKSTITSACGGLWKGILVEGNGTTQGKVILRSNGIIEHAQVGIDLSDYSSSNNSGFTGGSLDITGGTLLNNQIGVKVHSGDLPSKYTLYLPNFHINDDFKGSKKPILVDLRNTSASFNILSGEFSDDRISVNPSLRATGIESLNSAFRVNSYTTLGVFSKFKDLHRGIDASGFSLSNTYFVFDTKFENCITGIYSGGVSNFRVKNNDFSIARPAGSSFPEEVVGVKLSNNASGFDLSNNDFVYGGNPINVPANTTIGVDVCNLGGSDNIIEKNIFENLAFGNRALSENANSNRNRGLLYLCNELSNELLYAQIDITDFLVENGAIKNIQAGVNDDQQAPTNNKFSEDDDILEFTFNNKGTPLEYKFDGSKNFHDPNVTTHFGINEEDFSFNSYDCFDSVVPNCPLCPIHSVLFKPMIQGKIAELENATDPNEIEQLEGEIYALQWGLNQQIREQVWEFYADTVEVNMDSIIHYMKFSENFYDDIQIAQFYFFNEDFVAFDDFWNVEIPARHNLEGTSSEQQIYNDLDILFVGLRPFWKAVL